MQFSEIVTLVCNPQLLVQRPKPIAPTSLAPTSPDYIQLYRGDAELLLESLEIVQRLSRASLPVDSFRMVSLRERS